jgi:5-formyltetrahydrofolate cyclo-ligase
MNIQARKQALRQRIIAARDNLTPSLRAHLSQQIVRQVCGLKTYQSARTVLGYLNFGSELHSELWVQQALRDGKQVLLPRVNKASKRLALFEVSDLSRDVAPGLWGIREPIIEQCKPFDALGQLDFILLPGVAFDSEGGRLGYGGGFYDKLLASLPHRPTLVAGAFELQVITEIPQESTDHRIDWLVTENELISCTLGRE